MNVVKDVHARIYSFINATPESCEMLPIGENRKLERQLQTYLQTYKNMTRDNVSSINDFIDFG